MYNKFLALLIFFVMMIIFSGCSGDQQSLVSSRMDMQDEIQIPVASDSNTQSFPYFGIWTMGIDTTSMTSSIESMRMAGVHYNVRPYLPKPIIVINSYNPVSHVVDVDMTISNPFKLDAYDTRIIVFTDSIGHKLTNADDWTSLYDIPGGRPINPFKACNTDNPDRIFLRNTQTTVNLKIYLPGGNPNVNFAIDASYPSHCQEPYEIKDFNQGILYDEIDSSTNVTVNIFDWQNNVNSVNLYCPNLTGSPLVPFEFSGANSWIAYVINANGLPEGNYTGYLIARSSDSGSLALYDEVTITVTRKTSEVEPVGDLSVLGILRGEGDQNRMLITSVHFDWEPSARAVEYAFERGDTSGDWNDVTWSLVGATTDHFFIFNPVNNDLDDDIWFRVIARAEVGGNPETDAAPSEPVFILFVSNAGEFTGNPWTFAQKDTTDGIYMTYWYGFPDDDLWGTMDIGFYGDPTLPNTNTWAITHTPQRIPDIEGQKEAFCDGWISWGANWSIETLGFCIGTLTESPPEGALCPDFQPANDMINPSYWPYNQPNCDGVNTQFEKVHQDAYKLLYDNTWRHVGYRLNELLEPQRDYIGIGYANGNKELPYSPT